MAVATSPYQTAQDALDIAIVESNDGGGPNGMEGNVLNPNSNAQVLPAFQENWTYLQDRLISGGADEFTQTQPVFNLSASMNPNGRVPMRLTYNGYFNGVVWTGPTVSAPTWNSGTTYTQGMTTVFGNQYYVALPNSDTNLNQQPDSATTFWAPFNNLGPTLPANLVKPLYIKESPAGQNFWVPMTQAPNDLTLGGNKSQRFGTWLYENNTLLLPPSTSNNDLEIQYLGLRPPISSWDSPLMVRGCGRALAFLVLTSMSGGRGGNQAGSYKSQAEEALDQILNRTVRKMAYSSFARIPFRGPRNRGRRSGM
jgi:hypothetical protein